MRYVAIYVILYCVGIAFVIIYDLTDMLKMKKIENKTDYLMRSMLTMLLIVPDWFFREEEKRKGVIDTFPLSDAMPAKNKSIHTHRHDDNLDARVKIVSQFGLHFGKFDVNRLVKEICDRYGKLF